MSSGLGALTADTGENPVRETTQREDAQEEDMLEEGTQEGTRKRTTGRERRPIASVAGSGVCRSRCAGLGQAWAAAPWLRTTDW